MPHAISTTIDIEAPPEAVWDVLVDLDRHPEWNPFLVEAEGEVAVGSRLRLRMQPPGGRAMRFRPRVTVVEPARTFEWLGHLGVPGLFDGRHRFELHPTETGTRLVHGETFRGLLVRLLARSLDEGTTAGFDAMNRALRDRVLAGTAA